MAVQGVLYQSILNTKLTGRNKLGRKMCTSNRDDCKLENTANKADSNTWESFTRSELKLESVNQESPRSDIFRKRATKPLLKQKHSQKHLTWAKEKNYWTVAQCFKVLFSDESKFCISFGNQGPRIWRKSEEAQNLPGHFRALHASFCWQGLWRCWFHFPAGFGTCPHCQRYQKLVQWSWCHSAWLASKLAWPEPHRESIYL